MSRFTWRRKSAAIAAAVLAMAGILSGCGASSDSGDGKTTLTIFCDFPASERAYHSDLSENPVVQKMMEQTGLKLEFIHAPAGDDGSYFQQLLASGDLPDLMYGNQFQTSYPGGVEGAIEDGVLYDVTELVKNGAPNFWALVDEEGEPQEEMDRKLYGDSGKLIKYGTTFLPPTDNKKVFTGLVVRKDWLDKYGLEAPVTLDDYTNVLRTFKENGVQVPLALPRFTESQFYTCSPIASAFDVTIQDFQVDDEGKIHYSRTQDGYKKFLETLKSWAEEGLIDTDFVSRNMNDTTKLFNNGTAGMTFMHTYDVKTALTAGPAVDPEFEILATEMPKVNAEDETHIAKATSSINSYSWQVSASSKHPEEAVAFMNYLMDPNTLLMSAWGTNEDPNAQTYTEDEQGNRSFTDFVTNNPDGLDYNTVRALYMCAPFQIKYDETMEASQYSPEACHQSWDAWGKQNDSNHALPAYLTLTTDESKELTEIKTKLANYSDEMVYRFIFGEEDLESGWDAFVAQLKELGSERGEEINQAAYDRYLARAEKVEAEAAK